jgi:CheY-like chemotaxis protein
MTNLVVNARDAMPTGGRLSIATATCTNPQTSSVTIEPGDYAELRVSDTGLGIPPEHLANIFEPFFTTKASGKGTGLGLATVYGIVKQAGGYILVESEVGRGSTFRVLLPLCSVPHVENAADAGAAAVTPPSRMTILLVEDEPQVREVVVRLLRRVGFTTIAAGSPSEALARLRNDATSFDLVLSDVVMPGMSGVELAAEARKIIPGLPFVFMSGYSPDHAALGGQWQGEEPLVPKPLEIDGLLAAFTTALDRRSGRNGSAAPV